jgi:hypothetical protein
MRIRVASMLLIAGVVGAAVDAGAEPPGVVTHAGVEMPVRGVVALWDAERPSLRVHLLPFEPTAQEVHDLQSEKSFFFFNLERESPDPGKWPTWMPHARYEMIWSFEKDKVGDHDAAWLFIYGFGIGEAGSNLNLNSMAGEHKGKLTGEVKPGSTITLVAAGQDEIGGDVLSWDLSFTTEVLELLGKEE